MQRSGPTRIPQVEKARQAFFTRAPFTERGIWDKFLFDGNPDTAFKARGSGGLLRIDLGKPTTLGRLLLRLAKPNSKAIEEARYNILDDADLKDAATKMNSFLKALKSAKLKRVK